MNRRLREPLIWPILEEDKRKAENVDVGVPAEKLREPLSYRPPERKEKEVEDIEVICSYQTCANVQTAVQDPLPDNSSSVISLKEFLNILSSAYLETETSDVHSGDSTVNSYIDWSHVCRSELFAGLVDINREDIFNIIGELPGSLIEPQGTDCEAVDYYDYAFRVPSGSTLTQVSSKSSVQSELTVLDKPPFRIRVEFRLKEVAMKPEEMKRRSTSDIPKDVKEEKAMAIARRDSLQNVNVKDKINRIKARRPNVKTADHPVKNKQGDDRLLGSPQKSKPPKVPDEAKCGGDTKNISIPVQKPSDKSTLNPPMSRTTEPASKESNRLLSTCESEVTESTLRPKAHRHVVRIQTSPTSDDDVEIHATDHRNTRKDFRCPRELLVSRMGYFAQVETGRKLEDLDITVHCDIKIFEWLMTWVKKDFSSIRGPMPTFDVHNAVPILMSASFFQMGPLLEMCLNYCRNNINDVIKSSTDLRCLNDNIISRLADMFANVQLENVKDKEDKIQSRLFCKMISALAHPEPEPWRGHFVSFSNIFKCVHCNKLLLRKVSSSTDCVPNRFRIDMRGNVIADHEWDTSWTISDYIRSLKRELNCWRKVYWRMWAECHFLYCLDCHNYYPVISSDDCWYHPKRPYFIPLKGSTTYPIGIYACCNSKAFKFELVRNPRHGCTSKKHNPSLKRSRCSSDIQNIFDLYRAVVFDELCSGYSKMPSLNPKHDGEDKEEQGNRKLRHSNYWWNGFDLTPTPTRNGLLGRSLGTLTKENPRLVAPNWIAGQTTCDEPQLDKSSDESITDENKQETRKKKLVSPETCVGILLKAEKKRAKASHNSMRGRIGTHNKQEDVLECEKNYDNNANDIVRVKVRKDVTPVLNSTNSDQYFNPKIFKKSVEFVDIDQAMYNEILQKELERYRKNSIRFKTRLNQDNLRDYENKLMIQISATLCRRVSSIKALQMDKIPYLMASVPDQTDMDSSKAVACKRSRSSHSVTSSVKTYCSTISSTVRIMHSRTTPVWNSFDPLAGTYVRVEAEWKDTFNAPPPPKARKTRRQAGSTSSKFAESSSGLSVWAVKRLASTENSRLRPTRRIKFDRIRKRTNTAIKSRKTDERRSSKKVRVSKKLAKKPLFTYKPDRNASEEVPKIDHKRFLMQLYSGSTNDLETLQILLSRIKYFDKFMKAAAKENVAELLNINSLPNFNAKNLLIPDKQRPSLNGKKRRGKKSSKHRKRSKTVKSKTSEKNVNSEVLQANNSNWKAIAPHSKTSEIKSYLSSFVVSASKNFQCKWPLFSKSKVDVTKVNPRLVPPCGGKRNVAFTCGYSDAANMDAAKNCLNPREEDFVNPIWMFDQRYNEMDYLSCSYMPVPFHRDYDVVKGIDWKKFRLLEREWKGFLKIMKIDELVKPYFHHAPIKPYFHGGEGGNKRMKLSQMRRIQRQDDYLKVNYISDEWQRREKAAVQQPRVSRTPRRSKEERSSRSDKALVKARPREAGRPDACAKRKERAALRQSGEPCCDEDDGFGIKYDCYQPEDGWE